MASTQITVENRTDIPIYALLTWAGDTSAGWRSKPHSHRRRPRGRGGTGHHRVTYPSGNIPCEYVWYDFWILDNRYGLTRDGEVGGVIGGTTLEKKQARGSTSWIFERTGEQGYRLWQP